MPEYQHLLYEQQQHIAYITLNNPSQANAFDDQIIHDLTELLQHIDTQADIHVVILQSAGKHFSAGANLSWMQRMATYNREQNIADANKLSTLLHTLNSLSKPTIAVVQGKAMGGGVGLVACCDIAIADSKAALCFSEVKLGLIPATIAPYVVNKIGYGHARHYFISAEMIDAQRAKEIGLIQHICDSDLADYANAIAQQLLSNSPNAMHACKQLLTLIAGNDSKLQQQTAELLADIRSSSQAQQGIHAFLNKQPISWTKSQ